MVHKYVETGEGGPLDDGDVFASLKASFFFCTLTGEFSREVSGEEATDFDFKLDFGGLLGDSSRD